MRESPGEVMDRQDSSYFEKIVAPIPSAAVKV